MFILTISVFAKGCNKIILNHLEKLFCTSDAATIVKEIEIVHPTVKIIVDASKQQEAEMGDGTNFVIVLTGELLKKAQNLLKMGLHVSEVIDGYRNACNNVRKIMPDLVCYEVKSLNDKEELLKVVYAPICAKHLGTERKLSELVTEACLMAMPTDPIKFDVDSIRTTRHVGGSFEDSNVMSGMVVSREPEGAIKKIQNARIAVFACPIDISMTETKGTVLLRNANDMLNFGKAEEARLEQTIRRFRDEKINVVVTSGTVGELALHFLNIYGIMLLRIPSKFDLRRLCRLVSATALPKFVSPLPNEIGSCESVGSINIGSDICTYFDKVSDKIRTVTISIRGGTQGLLEDVERGIDDAVRVVKDVANDRRMLPGAGAIEMELAHRLRLIAEKTPGMDQYAMMAFAEALEIFPHTMAENSGFDAVVTISNLSQMHADKKVNAGINIDPTSDGTLPDVSKNGILDSFIVKQYALEMAVYAAITILSIDQVIMSKPSGGPKPRDNPNWDED